MSGYYLSNTSNPQCIACSQNNCQICTNSSACDSCSNGYYLTNGTCTACLSGCESCSNSTVCSDCFEGYYLSQNATQCTKCVQGCSSCVAANVCRSCSNGFYLQYVNGVTNNTCARCSPPCLQCQYSSNYCTICMVGWQMTEAGVCAQCPKGCLACDGYVGCYYCAAGYLKLSSSTDNVS